MTGGGDAADTVAEEAILARLAAAEPPGSKSLAGLIDRLRDAGRLRAVVDPDGPARTVRGALDAGRIRVTGVAYDSRRVQPGGCFVAIPGAHADGHAFVGAAVRAGVGVLVVERPARRPRSGPPFSWWSTGASSRWPAWPPGGTRIPGSRSA